MRYTPFRRGFFLRGNGAAFYHVVSKETFELADIDNVV